MKSQIVICLFVNSRAQESDDDEDQISTGVVVSGSGEGEGEDAGGIARELAARFHDLRTCSELVSRHGQSLQRSLVELETPPTDTTKQVSERATLFRISCNAMMNVGILIVTQSKGLSYCVIKKMLTITLRPKSVEQT